MSVLKDPPKMKIFLAAYAKTPELIERGTEALWRGYENGVLGAPDILSEDFPMTDTNYYAREMGENLVKRYLSFPAHLEPQKLVEIKHLAMEIERTLSEDGKRRVNLDPGYVFAGGLVLSTGKFSLHRLYLGGGVWGELSLGFANGEFLALPWSYRDYLRPEVRSRLMEMRKAYLRAERPGARDVADGAGQKSTSKPRGQHT
ncbi:MAG: DUF4416 family protein [Deltaproteobacteria bacterium]|jgi:hypothetical protein|nr:DUF4416 family protein [Deltaproteobacteria bacterium]